MPCAEQTLLFICLFEIAQQPFECDLVLIMIFPGREIADVALMLHQRSPASVLSFQDRIIQPDREENGAPLPGFPGQRGFDFMLHPIAGHGMFGEDQQELILQVYSLINAWADLVADLYILRGKPAAHAMILQIRV